MERFIKICGITNREDALWAAKCGATAVGFIFAKESPRRIGLEAAKKIVSALPRRDRVQRIGVFVNERVEIVNECIRELGLAYAQLHGEEPPDYCRRVEGKVIKAIRVADHPDPENQTEKMLGVLASWREKTGEATSRKDAKAQRVSDAMRQYTVSAFLLDTFSPEKRGGTGETFNWSLAVEAKERGVPIILSGGLNPENVVAAIETVAPAGVDASSGVEISPGKKHQEKVRSFVERATRAFERLAAAQGGRKTEKAF